MAALKVFFAVGLVVALYGINTECHFAHSRVRNVCENFPGAFTDQSAGKLGTCKGTCKPNIIMQDDIEVITSYDITAKCNGNLLKSFFFFFYKFFFYFFNTVNCENFATQTNDVYKRCTITCVQDPKDPSVADVIANCPTSPPE